MVFSPEYRLIIERTPHIKYRTSWILKGCLIFVGAVIVLAVIAAILSSRLVAAAVRAGATGVNGPNFFVGNPGAAYNSALTAAFDQARERAAALAARAGAALGPALSIEEGGGVATPEAPQAKSAPAGEAPPVKPGTSTVTATVHVVFALQ